MQSLITSKFQITIPKSIREKLKLAVHDTLEWKIEDDKVVVYPVQNKFLRHRNVIRVGSGEIREDVENARRALAEKLR